MVGADPLAVLRHFPLAGDAVVTPVAESFNAMFRVECRDARFVLRIGPTTRVHAAGADEAEALWLTELAVSGLDVPRVIRTIDGAASVSIGARRCSVLTWMPGSPSTRPVDGTAARAVGRLVAQLHDASPPCELRPTGTLDGSRATLFDVPDRLGELPDPVFAAARRQAQEALDGLYRTAGTPPRRVHTDLSPGNLLSQPHGMAAIDFQDLAWAHVEQDLANCLYGLTRGVDTDGTHDDVRAGYATVRPWPPALDDDLSAHLVAARRCSVVNLAIAIGRVGEPGYLDRHAGPLRDYVRSV